MSNNNYLNREAMKDQQEARIETLETENSSLRYRVLGLEELLRRVAGEKVLLEADLASVQYEMEVLAGMPMKLAGEKALLEADLVSSREELEALKNG